MCTAILKYQRERNNCRIHVFLFFPPVQSIGLLKADVPVGHQLGVVVHLPEDVGELSHLEEANQLAVESRAVGRGGVQDLVAHL